MYASARPEVHATIQRQAKKKELQPKKKWTTSSRRSVNATCGHCGYKTHSSQDKCPAKGKTCNKCHKINHFEKVCRSKKVSVINNEFQNQDLFIDSVKKDIVANGHAYAAIELEMEDQNKVTFALLGLGRIGQVHLANLLANNRVSLLCVVEGNIELAQKVLKENGLLNQVQVYGIDEIQLVLDDERISSIFICTPTDTHADIIRRALKAGKHVICEKPISENSKDITACFDDAEKYNRILMAAFNRKFDPSVRELYTRVKQGNIGDLHVIKATFRDHPLWTGMDCLTQTFLIHDIDMICWFNDGLPERVVCMATANLEESRKRNDLDTVAVTMQFANGVIGILDFCRYSPYGYDIRLEVMGSEGMLAMEHPTISTVKTYKIEGKSESPHCGVLNGRFSLAYIAELNHFIDSVQGKSELEVKREYSERCGIVNDAIRESYRTGKVILIKEGKLVHDSVSGL
ncbi:hypothetical protein CHS0354_020534 [Potamilus streckersoni]|uniref:Uncharacterized protein n=1 Tax=Potamilus streckersoni TaxID=2493646 RepID=A0AAE0SLJ1_9BIVA|nr:hypothetical protein CHS0354_020534 [Potamilus streckersoni]